MNSQVVYTPPEFEKSSFNCPFCNAYANQIWSKVYSHIDFQSELKRGILLCKCFHCKRNSIWHEEKMVYPDFYIVEPVNADLNEDIKRDYVEAAEIVQKSPRGAAALLRLAIQKLCIQLGEKGENLNTDIGNSVKKGLACKGSGVIRLA